jgi:hypothetical protein
MSSNSTVRTGRVSSIDYKRGTYEVTYTDRGQSVTKQVNGISNGEYKMPKIGQVVSVNHNSNGTAQAVSTGSVWNNTNTPAEGYAGLYRKEYGDNAGDAYEKYDANTGLYRQYTKSGTGRNTNGSIFDEAKGSATFMGAGAVQVTSSGSSASMQAKTNASVTAGQSVSIDAGTTASIEAKTELGLSSDGKLSIEISGKTTETYNGDITKKVKADTKNTYTGDIKDTVEGDVKKEVTGDTTVILTGKATINVTGSTTLNINGCNITISEAGDVSITSPTKIDMSAPQINVKGDSGDVKIDGISLKEHKHGGGPEPDR